MSLPVAHARSPQEIVRASGSSFSVSFAFLAPARRRALTAIYAFCRVVDDAVDDAPDPVAAREHLEFWRAELGRAAGRGDPITGVGSGVREAITRFGVASKHLEEVVEGMAMDLEPRRFDEPDELERYCYRVASAVGLACLPVMRAGERAQPFAEALGRALQWTNILRDLRVDARRGRVYAPRRWLQEEGVDEAWLAEDGPPGAHDPGGAVACLAARLAERAERHFAAAAAALPREDRKVLLPARIMGAVYRDLLRRLRRRGGALGGNSVRVPRARKMYLATRTWLGIGW